MYICIRIYTLDNYAFTANIPKYTPFSVIYAAYLQRM